jgi:hypothetical protein
MTIQAIFLVLIIGLVGGIVVYFVLRHLKGKLTLEVVNRVYGVGDIVSGQVHLHCKKDVDCNRFYVALICQEVVQTYRKGKRHTTRRELVRQEQDLTGPGRFAPGTMESYAFDLVVPSVPTRDFQVATGSETVDAIVNTVASLASHRGRLEWKLEARVDAQGVDLAATQRVSVNAG